MRSDPLRFGPTTYLLVALLIGIFNLGDRAFAQLAWSSCRTRLWAETVRYPKMNIR